MTNKLVRRLVVRALSTAIFCLLLLVFTACERPMRIAVTKDSNPPSFELSGSGSLIFFTVFEVIPGKTSSVNDPVMWKIEPTKDRRISNLPGITYGVIPPGFAQATPSSGAPPPLVEGKVYEVGGPADFADGGSLQITIRNGKTVVVSSSR